jgi:hypothetical protein
MARPKPVSFNATKVVKKPTTVFFKTKSGEIVKFKAVKGVKETVRVRFTPKRK